ncbi:MAG: hypothetical protein WC827_01880 [Candidatus Paceibacterota bacterium]|jgi:ribosomal protein S21
MINIEVEKNSNESNASILRRFTKKVQGSGILPRVRSIRYSGRKLSPYKTKINKLSALGKKAEVENLIKMGKMVERENQQKRK